MNSVLSIAKWIIIILSILLFLFLGSFNTNNFCPMTLLPGIWSLSKVTLSTTLLLSFAFGDANPGPMGRSAWTIVGDEGILTLEQDTSIWVERGEAREELEPQGRDVPPAISFVGCILDGTPNLSPGEDAAYSAALIEAAYRSAAEGRIVRLKLPESSRLP